jgi:hypothetical protein
MGRHQRWTAPAAAADKSRLSRKLSDAAWVVEEALVLCGLAWRGHGLARRGAARRGAAPGMPRVHSEWNTA